MTVSFTAYVDAVPYRERTAIRAGRAHSYRPQRQKDAQYLVQKAALEAFGERAPMEGPLELIVIARRPYPASMSKKRRAITRFVTTRPDSTNVLKLVEDACAPLWHDDAQVARTAVERVYTDGPARIEVTITPIT
ncbi:MAG: RusA family crossover junction endodeoxyribonuclease [Candidatus Dormibacteria bacterium]